MSEVRNTFRMRASEHIESDSTFLRLFGPGVLDLLPKDGTWDRVQIFRSSPGGGKTSLFRLFTPQSLLTLYDSRTSDDFKDLYQKLKSLEVISEEGPSVLGTLLPCARNYADLEDLEFEKGYKQRLFYSLLNSRITLAALKAALAMCRLPYPTGLPRLQIQRPRDPDIPTTIPVPCSGTALYEWASSLEAEVCNTIDSFGSPQANSLVSHDTLYCLFLLRTGCIHVDGNPLPARTLLMLDDVHKLSRTQRGNLLSVLFQFRLPIGIWLAERLEALSPEELLTPGATSGREYQEAIVLEEFWRREGNSKRYEHTVANIADRRAKLNPDVQIGTFAGCLHQSLDGSEWNNEFADAVQVVSQRVREKAQKTRNYDSWIKSCEDTGWTLRERALKWRVLEIMIERDLRKAQQRLFDSPIPQTQLEVEYSSAVREAAELFLSREFRLPYHFGFSVTASISSSNIEQFLEIAGDLFEEIISAELLRQNFVLSPTRQEEILRKVAKRRWDEIQRLVPNARDVLQLLEALHQLCRWETDRPNAPYAPGVTGIAISMLDRARLIDPRNQETNPQFARLARALSACISLNLLEASLDRSQGQREGKTWMILYLNRLFCLHFDLPLQYGGWRSRTITELCKYLDEGFKPSRKMQRLV